MTHVLNFAKAEVLRADIDFETGDLRLMLVKTGSTAATENDGISSVGDYTTLNEFAGTNYTTGGEALVSKTVTVDDTNDRAEFDAADLTFTSLGADGNVIGALLILFITNTATSVPISFHTISGTPDGNNFQIQMNSEGILQLS